MAQVIRALDLGRRVPRVELRAPLVRIADLVRLSLVLLMVGQLGRLPVAVTGGKEAPILFNDLVLAVVLAGAALVAVRTRSLVLDRTAGAALVFALSALLSTLLAVPRFSLTGFEFLFSVAYLARWLAYFSLYVVVLNFVRKHDVDRVWRAFEALVVIFCTFGLFQSAFLPDFAQIVYPDSIPYVDWDPQGHRLMATFLDPNFAGMLIVMALLVMLGRLAFGVRSPAWKWALFLLALGLTVSRGAVLSFVAGLAVIALVRGHSRPLVRWGAVVALASVPFLPFLVVFASGYAKLGLDDPSAMSRVVTWLMAFEIFADHPVLGIGFNTYGFVQQQYGFGMSGNAMFGLNGGLLFILVLTGIVGLVLYGLILLSVMERSRAVWLDRTEDASHRGLALGAAAVTVALLVNGLFLNSLLFPFLMQPLWVLWGLVAVVRLSPR